MTVAVTAFIEGLKAATVAAAKVEDESAGAPRYGSGVGYGAGLRLSQAQSHACLKLPPSTFVSI